MSQQNHTPTPKTAVLMVSPRDYRLSSLSGYCMIFKKDVPVGVPPHVFQEALIAGIVMVEGEEDKKAPEPKKEDPRREEAAALAKEAAAAALKTALTVIITRNDPTDFKADNMPKLNKVVAEMAPEFPRPTATEISDAYQKLQSDIDLVED